MRLLFALILLLPAACAMPQGGLYSYGDNHIPAGAHVREDGTIVARATVWKTEELELARQAAIRRIQTAAVDGGYESIRLNEMKVVETPSLHVVVSAQLYKAGDAPPGAMSLDALGSGVLAVADAGLMPHAEPRELGGEPDRKPVQVISSNASGKPLVIAAPDFVAE